MENQIGKVDPKTVTDFKQPKEIGIMDIRITDAKIIVKDRQSSKQQIQIRSPLITVSQELRENVKSQRLKSNPNLGLTE